MSLDFEAILGLLFFIVFVVLPLVQGNKRKQQQQQRRQEDARSANQPAVPQASAQPWQPTTISGPPPAQPGSRDPLLATMEEIRRRVREAQEREDAARRPGGQPRASATVPATAQTSQPSRGSLVGADPFESTLVSAPGRTLSGGTYDPSRGGAQSTPSPARPSPPRPVPPPSLGREGVSQELKVERLGPLRPSVRPSVSERDPKLMKPFARGQLRPGESGARIGAGPLLTIDKESILRGLIWHEVLSEPWILKHRRRKHPGAPAR